MIAYLNGLGKPKKRPFGGKGKKALDKLKATGKKLNDERKKLDKKLIAKAKDLAKKAGAGIKRFANIPKQLAEKSLIKALEKNFLGLSTRLKDAYKKTPDAVKTLLKPLGDYEKIKAAINKGDKKLPAMIGEYKTRQYETATRVIRKRKRNKTMPTPPVAVSRQRGESDESFYKRIDLFNMSMKIYKQRLKDYLNKGRLSGDEEGAGAGGEAEATAEQVKQGVGLIKKIIEFFKKRKEGKAGDDEAIEGMGNSVDADPDIEKTDENGKPLPVPQEAKDINKIDKETAEEEKEGGIMSNKPLLIGGVAAALIGGYFLLKKK
jgi:hypothetical protein